jgi:hypothetical protein
MSADEINLSGLALAPQGAKQGGGSSRVSKTTILIIAAVFVLAALGGGYYYYRSIYQPRVYVRAIAPLYESAGLLGSETATRAAPKGPADPLDYAGAAEAIAARARSMSAARAEIVAVKPPNANLADFHRGLIEVIDLTLAASAEAEEHARFLAALLLLKQEFAALKEFVQSPESRLNVRTVGDLKNAWLPHFNEAKSIGTEAFSEKARSWGTSDASFAELTALWDKVTTDIDFFVSMLGSMSASVRLEDFGSRLTKKQNERGEEGFRNFEKIIEDIDGFTRARSATAIMDIGASPGRTGIVLSEKAFATLQALEELKRRHLGE